MWQSVSRLVKDVAKSSNEGPNSEAQSLTADEELARLRQELADARMRIAELEREKSAIHSGGGVSQNVGAIVDSGIVQATDETGLPVAFCTDASPREGKTNVLRAGSGFIWEHEYDRGAVARPNDRLTKKGEWTTSTFPKLQRTNELIARVDGQWCYMGTFAPAGSENVGYDAWEALPDAVSAKSCGRMA
ncbi:hypothetical protein PHLGIDRAFT_115328 [Phlebiopsis gigantea 11061_1 CR5-6]|uniref:Uncharacterized protein n=1 Tax=Phlebiopsis gigantea (strain 11061_1 CR5-6) TaxID=745531 RepID=A0A0C3SC37_PHLG1|nr:hypothetical protein PHLGIDRAFT_115328 [Phlebiopsis gigantea 11061_1 CR5-6]